MLTIRKPDAEEEHKERHCLLSEGRSRPAKKLLQPDKADEREHLDGPNSLFWRGVWMVVF
ncbi:hypothetical protein [Sinorhizobium sp. BJ1]|uniref:hypothetical protein n=1 Tax=Sinorhizobium sp. BJ1 TaxID=2035455 RepID=UPI000BE9DCAE|nr:hypothetical protein [Sinorhizobium sp. BJ1]PDT82501.1 hypothetical protein CO676_17385 [Sinorhizobium sp. BJ1]